MRIGILHNAYRYRGGEERVAESEARLLEAAGHHVARLEFDNRVEFASLGPKLKSLARSSTGWNTNAADRIQEWVRAERLDLVHVHNLFPLITAAGPDAIRALRVPLVATLHNFRAFCANGTLTRNQESCTECTSQGATRAVVHGCWAGSRLQSASWMLAQARARSLWEHDRITFIAPSPHVRDRYRAAGLDHPNFVVRPHHADVPTTQSGERRGAVVIGRVDASKGVLDLIAAWPSDAEPLTIVGDGPELRAARDLAGPNVRCTGPLDAQGVADQFGRAKVLLSASMMPETFGLTLIEAAGNGAVALAFRNGGSTSIIEHDRSGLLVDRGDFRGLVHAAQSLLCDDARRGAMASRARARYESLYSPQVGLASLEAIYQSALGVARAAS